MAPSCPGRSIDANDRQTPRDVHVRMRPVESVREQVVLAECSIRRGSFGIILKRKGEMGWSITWASVAVPIFPPGATRQLDLTGGLIVDPSYPGCPHCSGGSIFRCGRCGTVNCWDGSVQHVTCAKCGNAATLSGTISVVDSQHG